MTYTPRDPQELREHLVEPMRDAPHDIWSAANGLSSSLNGHAHIPVREQRLVVELAAKLTPDELNTIATWVKAAWENGHREGCAVHRNTM